MDNRKSNSSKIRNNLVEISFIESLLYKYSYMCKEKCTERVLNEMDKSTKKIKFSELKKKEDNCMIPCNDAVQKIFGKYEKILSEAKASHKKCMILCTDKLNFPSEELLCYDKCEDEYNNILESNKEKLFADFNQIKSI